jgi:hypothetical protein
LTKFNRFEDIEHKPLRVYNRAVMTFNIKDDQGVEAARDYLETFTQQERFEIAQITALTKKRGPKIVKEIVTSGLEFTDEDYVEPTV